VEKSRSNDTNAATILEGPRETCEDGRRARQGSKGTFQDSLLFLDHNKGGAQQHYAERLTLMCVEHFTACRVWRVVTRNNDHVYFGHVRSFLGYCFRGDTYTLHR
jgi:hypothetical protein